MSAIMRLRQARNAEQLANEIEPLAQSLANLVDETQQTLQQQTQASIEQANTWSKQQQEAAQTLQQTALRFTEAAQQLKHQAEVARRVTYQLTWSVFIIAILSGGLAAVLTSAFWLWVAPPQVHFTIDPKAVAQMLKPELSKIPKKPRK